MFHEIWCYDGSWRPNMMAVSISKATLGQKYPESYVYFNHKVANLMGWCGNMCYVGEFEKSSEKIKSPSQFFISVHIIAIPEPLCYILISTKTRFVYHKCRLIGSEEVCSFLIRSNESVAASLTSRQVG